MSLFNSVLAGLNENNLSLTTFHSKHTAGDLRDAVAKYESILKPLNIAGKRVALLVPAIQEFIPLFMAVNKLKGVTAPLSTQFRQEDLLSVLDFLDPHIVFTVNQHTGFNFSELVTDWAKGKDAQTLLFTSDDCATWGSQLFEGAEKELETLLGGIISFSSGSTGTPKGIFFQEDVVDLGFSTILEAYAPKATDRVLIYSATSTIFALYAMDATLKTGANFLVANEFDVVKIINLMKETKCNKFITTPSVFKAIYTFASKLNPEVLRNLELVGVAGEKIPDNWVDGFPLMKNCRFVSQYGSSESCALGWAVIEKGTKDLEYKVLTGVNVKAVDGELYAKTPGNFTEYYRNPKLTAESVEDGWYKLGDLVEFIDNETFKIIGRKKDIIKKGGQQVVPSEVEQLLTTIEVVKSAAVVGAPHSIYGEQVVAFVVADGLTASDIRTFCVGKISAYKVPDKVVFIKEMPLTQGKLDKLKLKSMLD
jgi:acyl-coenzyme A synthetase/AMP-(fatty) acid ligase